MKRERKRKQDKYSRKRRYIAINKSDNRKLTKEIAMEEISAERLTLLTRGAKAKIEDILEGLESEIIPDNIIHSIKIERDLDDRIIATIELIGSDNEILTLE